MDIREAISTLAGRQPSPIVVGTVTRTDGLTADIQPLDSNAAPLLAIDLGVGDPAAIGFLPDVGATVVVVMDSPTTGFVVGMRRGRLTLNGGGHGPMVIHDELRTQLEKMSRRIDGIIDALKGCGTDTYGGALQAGIATGLARITDKEDFGHMADNDITH